MQIFFLHRSKQLSQGLSVRKVGHLSWFAASMNSRSYISSPTTKKKIVTFLKTSLHFIFQTPNLFQDYSLIVLRPNKRPLQRETTSALICFESCLFVLICICDPALLCLKNKCKASAYGYVICSVLIFSSSVTV